METERLILRPYTLDDVEALYAIASDPDVGIHAGWKPHESLEESREVLENIFLPSGAWAVIEKESNKIIGCVALENDRLRPDANSRELGYWLVSTKWGKGLMTEAAKRVIQHGFSELGLDQIGICTSPLNIRSQRIIEKCGFTYEGTLRRTYRTYDGSLRDSRIYSMLRSEFEELYAAQPE